MERSEKKEENIWENKIESFNTLVNRVNTEHTKTTSSPMYIYIRKISRIRFPGGIHKTDVCIFAATIKE